MIIIHNYFVAISLTIVAMIAWGSWANTQKIAEKNWRFELYYWDMVIGIVFMSLIGAFTIGSLGNKGRSFLSDISQSNTKSILQAMLGGVLWNAGNLLLGGMIWCAAMVSSFMAIGAPKGTNALLTGMFLLYLVGLVLITASNE